MDSDNYTPQIVQAARILGLGEYIVKRLETEGITMKEGPEVQPANSIKWVNAAKEITQRITGGVYQLSVGEIFKPWHAILIQLGSKENFNKKFHNVSIEMRSVDGEENKEFESSFLSIGVSGGNKAGGGSFARRIIDALGHSDFVTFGPGLANFTKKQNTTLNWGLVNGTTGAPIFGIGFSCVRNAVGTYTITMEESLSGYSVVGSDAQNTGRMFSSAVLSNSQFAVTMRNPASLVTEDISFSFHVIGVGQS